MEFGISAFQDPGAEVNVQDPVCLQRFRCAEHSGMIWDESKLTVPGEVLLMFLEGKRPKALCSECHDLAYDEDVALCAPLLR